MILKDKFKSMTKELSEYSFYKLRGWFSHNFTNLPGEFDENIIPWEEEYFERFREYIYKVQSDYKIQENILITDVDQIAELFDFKDDKTIKLILYSIETTAQLLRELFMVENIMTGEVVHFEIDEEIQMDLEILDNFIEEVQIK